LSGSLDPLCPNFNTRNSLSSTCTTFSALLPCLSLLYIGLAEREKGTNISACKTHRSATSFPEGSRDPSRNSPLLGKPTAPSLLARHSVLKCSLDRRGRLKVEARYTDRQNPLNRPPRSTMSASLISAKTPDISIPQVRRIVVETRGAQIVQEESPAVSPVHRLRVVKLTALDQRLSGYLPTSLHRAGIPHCCRCEFPAPF
jgi:hypothetical protein